MSRSVFVHCPEPDSGNTSPYGLIMASQAVGPACKAVVRPAKLVICLMGTPNWVAKADWLNACDQLAGVMVVQLTGIPGRFRIPMAGLLPGQSRGALPASAVGGWIRSWPGFMP